MSRGPGEFQTLRPAPPDGSGPRETGPARLGLDETPPLRPRSTGELLDLAFEVLRARFGTIVGVAALLWLPMRAAQPLVGLHHWTSPEDLSSFSPLGFAFGFAFNTGGSVVVAFLQASVLAVLVSGHLEGRRTTAREALRRGLARLVPVAVIALLAGVLTGFGYVCLCVPGIVLTWLFYLAPAVCVLENASIAESLSRSVELAGRRILPWIPYASVAFLVGLPFSGLTYLADDPTARSAILDEIPISPAAFDWAMVPVTCLCLAVAEAIRGVTVTVWYYDCRARRDGADLAGRVGRAAVSWRAEPAP